MSSQAVQARLAAAQARFEAAGSVLAQAQEAVSAAQASLAAVQGDLDTWTQLAAEEDAESAPAVETFGEPAAVEPEPEPQA